MNMGFWQNSKENYSSSIITKKLAQQWTKPRKPIFEVFMALSDDSSLDFLPGVSVFSPLGIDVPVDGVVMLYRFQI